MKVKLLKKLRNRYIIYKLHGKFFLDDIEDLMSYYNYEGGFNYVLHDSLNNIKSIRREWILNKARTIVKRLSKSTKIIT
jgi:hypothetical protein